MRKKMYQKPSVKVYELRQTPRILAGSNGGGKLKNYTWNNSDDPVEE